MKDRLIGLGLVLGGLIVLLLIAVAMPANATGTPEHPHGVPSRMPYPDPSTGGVGTWTPQVSR